ncbi:MAG: glycosyl transferase family 1, partial [Nisaea sp.]|nr:glycosyl transferase family 1 [Nisaea sp.]
MAGGLGLILRLARRELRGGLSGFRIFLASLALGVAAIAAVGTVSSAILTGLNRDARVLLGGDVDLRSIHVPVAPAARDFADAEGTLTEIINMRAMAARAGDADGRRALVELKAVANAYPLVGAVTLSPAGPLDGALAFRDGVDGAVIDRALAARLGLTLGDVLEVGDARFAVRAFIDKEPDRVVSFATFGPRLMVALPALSKTGLVRQGSLIYYHTRVALDPGVDLDRWLTDFAAKFPDHGWRLRSRSQAAPGFSEFISRLGLYLSLVGLTSLL